MANGDNLTSYQYGNEAKIYERLIFDNRAFLLGIFIVLTVIFCIQTAKLKPDASFEKMIPMEHPYIQAMMEHIDELGASGTTISISVENAEGDIFDAEYMETLQKINDEVFYIKGVDRRGLKSLWTPNVRWTEVTEQGFDGNVVIPQNYDGSEESLEQLRKNILRSGQVGRLVADNFKSSIVEANLFDVDPETGEELDYLEFSRALEKNIREKYGSDKIKIHMVGFAKIVGDLLEGFFFIGVFAVITIIVTAGLLYFYSRGISGTFLPLLCSAIAVVWQLGLLTTFGYGLNAYAVLVPFLVFAIGVSHGVQVINAISIEMADGHDAHMAARRAFRILYVAGMTALVSDAVGFMTLIIIPIGVIKELAIGASIGVAVIILTNLVLLPVLMSYVGISKNALGHIQHRKSREPRSWTFLAKFAEPKYAKISVVIAILGYGFGIIAGQSLKIGDLDAGAPELRPNSTYNLDSKFINANYATSSDILLVMVETDHEACSTYENMETVDRFAWEMENVPGVQSAVSLVYVTKQVTMGFNEGNLKWNTLPRNQRAIDSTFFAVPPQLVNTECSLAPVAIFLTDHKAETLTRIVNAVEAFAEKNDTDSIRFRLGSGNSGVEAATNQEIENSQNRMLWLVYGVVCFLVYLSFNSLSAVACIIIPLGLTSILCQALMAHLGIGVKVATLPVIALGVGVGVDYGIYIYGRMEGFLKEGHSLPEAYLRTLKTTGKAVAFTGVTLAIGVGTWMWSPIKFQADMGKLLTFMFLWNMVGALWLLPAVAHFLIKPEKVRAKDEKKKAKIGAKKLKKAGAV